MDADAIWFHMCDMYCSVERYTYHIYIVTSGDLIRNDLLYAGGVQDVEVDWARLRFVALVST